MVDGAVEEALNLGGVEIDAHNPVCSGRFEQVSDQSGGNGFAPPTLLVLSRVRIEGSHHGDAFGARSLESVHHDQLLHQPFVDGVAVSLDDEGVSSADAFAITGINFTVRKGAGFCLQHLAAELFSDIIGKLWMGSARHDDQILLIRCR